MSRIMQFWALIVDCFREALDRKLFWVMVGISALIAATMACISFDETGVSVLFGKWHMTSDLLNTRNPKAPAYVGSILTRYIGDLYIGWIGIIFALIATAGIFPALMERGAVDVVLSKPMSRTLIFLGKYLGGMVFVALQAAIFVGLTFLVVGSRWGLWIWPYLWCIPLVVILFSYIYAFCALFGVITRNAMAALLLSILAWVGIYIPQVTYETLLTLPAMGVEIGDNWINLSKAAKLIVPKTRDITHIAGRLIGASTATEVFTGDIDDTPPPSPRRSLEKPIGGGAETPQHRHASSDQPVMIQQDIRKSIEAERKIADVNLLESIGSSLLFEAVILLIAIRKFNQRDF
ncbi:MAG: ABC transporter permease [Phycisphaerae bacterium]